MSVRMPEVNGEVLARRERIVATLRSIVPGEGVIAGEREMKPYERGWGSSNGPWVLRRQGDKRVGSPFRNIKSA